jgi:hypothetical protein
MTDATTAATQDAAVPTTAPASRRWIPGATKFKGRRGRIFDGRSSFGRRRRALIAEIVATFGGRKIDRMTMMQVEKFAELTLFAERLRAEVLTGRSDWSTLNRVEAECRDARQELGRAARRLEPAA